MDERVIPSRRERRALGHARGAGQAATKGLRQSTPCVLPDTAPSRVCASPCDAVPSQAQKVSMPCLQGRLRPGTNSSRPGVDLII